MEEGKLIITDAGSYKVPSISQCPIAIVHTSKSDPSTNSVGDHPPGVLLSFLSSCGGLILTSQGGP